MPDYILSNILSNTMSITMQTYTVSPDHAAHPAAREIVASSPAEAAERAYGLGLPCSPDYTYHVSLAGQEWEIATEDPDMETASDFGDPSPAAGTPDFFAEAFAV